MDIQKESTIAERNRDVEHIVNAAAKYGVYGLGTMFPKRFGLLITADPHRCAKQVKRAAAYMDEMDALDAGICLGDIMGASFTESDGTWYTDVVQRTKKPFYTLIGNHDGGNGSDAATCGTKKQVFEKFLMPIREQMGIPQLDKTYYSVRFDEYKICLIVLDNYDVPDERDEEQNFLIKRGVEMIGQEQANWFSQTLLEVPADYHVIIARHSITESCVPIQSEWTQTEYQIGGSSQGYVTENLVTDVVDAWIHGKSIECTYSSEKFPTIEPVRVQIDFAKRGKGDFVGYLVGHTHIDWLGVCEKYPEQHVINVASCANDKWQNKSSDLPRLQGTKAEDCITVLTVDTENGCVHLVRVGSNMTYNMTKRIYTSLKYK